MKALWNYQKTGRPRWYIAAALICVVIFFIAGGSFTAWNNYGVGSERDFCLEQTLFQPALIAMIFFFVLWLGIALIHRQRYESKQRFIGRKYSRSKI